MSKSKKKGDIDLVAAKIANIETGNIEIAIIENANIEVESEKEDEIGANRLFEETASETSSSGAVQNSRTGAVQNSRTGPNNAIINDLTKIRPNLSMIPAGFTYLGQMIAHDITDAGLEGFSDGERFRFSGCALKRSGDEESESVGLDLKGLGCFYRKKVSPGLDLDSIYGNKCSFKKSPFVDKNTGKFFIGCAEDSQSYEEDDLYRVDLDGKRIAIIPDPRNDQNLIIAQLHLLWQKFHNKIIDYQDAEQDLSAKQKYKRAKAFVTLVFQKVVVDEYLKHVLHPYVYDYACVKRLTYLVKQTDHGKLKSIPLEFSKAAFRFGHSMVRSSYDLNSRTVTGKIFKGPTRPIKKEQVINWDFFFGDTVHSPRPQKAQQIALATTRNLVDIEELGNINVIKADIKADQEANLIKGYDLYRYLIDIKDRDTNKKMLANHRLNLPNKTNLEKDLSFKGIALDHSNSLNSNAGIKAVGLKNASLLQFILREAEGKCPTGGSCGVRLSLGVIGSAIVAETIMASTRTAEINIFMSHDAIGDLLGEELRSFYYEFQNDKRGFRMHDISRFLN